MMSDRARNLRKVSGIADTLASSLGLDAARVGSRLHWVEHHPAHLASSFFRLAVRRRRGLCDRRSSATSSAHRSPAGRGPTLRLLDRVYFPHSLGMLYLAITQYLGFPKFGDEFKVMGLAPYGQPRHTDPIRQLIRLRSGGGFELDLSYFPPRERGRGHDVGRRRTLDRARVHAEARSPDGSGSDGRTAGDR